VSDLVAIEVVGTEFEADVVCGLLREAGVKCTHQATARGAAAMDGMPGGGPREVLVATEDAARARETLAQQT
jgi:hypothetical protein